MFMATLCLQNNSGGNCGLKKKWKIVSNIFMTGLTTKCVIRISEI